MKVTEVKGCTLCYDQESGTGFFPDAPRERGLMHLNELVRATKEGVEVIYYSCHVEADSIKITRVVGDTARYAVEDTSRYRNAKG